MTPQRIQLRRTAGWRKPEGAVVVSRPSKWGNPYWVGMWITVPSDRGQHTMKVDAGLAVELYRVQLGMTRRAHGRSLPTLDEIRAELRGRDLACWCPVDSVCHADVLLEIANSGSGGKS